MEFVRAESLVRATCDQCRAQEDIAVGNVTEARESLRATGWRTNIKPTTDRPSLHDNRVDLCPLCH